MQVVPVHPRPGGPPAPFATHRPQPDAHHPKPVPTSSPGTPGTCGAGLHLCGARCWGSDMQAV